MRKQVIREQLRLYIGHGLSPEVTIKRMKELVNILEGHPHLGDVWGRKLQTLLRDCEDALADLENAD